ncbi:hypothetical protein OROHE_014728 [Orobanche hederae]
MMTLFSNGRTQVRSVLTAVRTAVGMVQAPLANIKRQDQPGSNSGWKGRLPELIQGFSELDNTDLTEGMRMIIRKFGVPGIGTASYDANQVSDHILQGYTKGQGMGLGSDALAEYTVAMLTDSAFDPKKLSEISYPGDTDRLVPSWNSERLSLAIPGSCFEMIEKCGHWPQEEKCDEFVSIVDKSQQKSLWCC